MSLLDSSGVTAVLDQEQTLFFLLDTETLKPMMLEVVLLAPVLLKLAVVIPGKPLDQSQYTPSAIMWVFPYREECSILFYGALIKVNLTALHIELLYQTIWFPQRPQPNFIRMERQ